MLQVNVDKIYELMGEMSLTHDQLALMTGISRRTIYNLRKDPSHATLKQIDCIAETLGAKSYELIKWTPEARSRS